MAKIVFVVSPFVFIILFSSSVCADNDTESQTSADGFTFYPPLKKLATWYATHVTEADFEFYHCLLNAQFEIQTLRQNLENALEKAFAYSCLLGLQNQVNSIRRNFPRWLANSNLNERGKWEAFFSIEPETADQKKYQNRLRKTKATAFHMGVVIETIYENAPKTSYRVLNCQKFLAEKSLMDMIPKCCDLLRMDVDTEIAPIALHIILQHEQKGEWESLKANNWTSNILIQILGLNSELQTQDIEDCLKLPHTDANGGIIPHEIRIHEFQALNEQQIFVIEYFSANKVDPSYIEGELKQCKRRGVYKQMINENDYRIFERHFKCVITPR